MPQHGRERKRDRGLSHQPHHASGVAADRSDTVAHAGKDAGSQWLALCAHWHRRGRSPRELSTWRSVHTRPCARTTGAQYIQVLSVRAS